MGIHVPALTPSPWWRRTAIILQRLSLVCEIVALVGAGGPTEMVARGLAVGLRVIACVLDRPAEGSDGRTVG